MRGWLVGGALLLIAAGPVSIELPGEFVAFPELAGGPSNEAVNSNCLSCHSAEMVMHQPRLSAVEWQAEVSKMRSTYKAPVAESDDAAIVAWLTEMQARRGG